MDNASRRQFLKLSGSALVIIPILAASGQAFAAQNAAMRSSLKYQDKPGPDGKDCVGCSQFVPGKNANALGGCKLYPGDTEIAPKGYCVAWAKKP